MTKTVLITGGAGGIGREFCKLFNADGYRIIVFSLLQDELDALGHDLKAQRKDVDYRGVQMDLSQPGAAEAIMQWLDQERIELDVLVNNVGFGMMGEHVEQDSKKLERMLTLNNILLSKLCMLVGQTMKARGRGKILNIGSLAGFCPMPFFAAYSASKACAEIVASVYQGALNRADNPVRIATARGGNVVGGGDWSADRIVPDIVRALASGAPIVLRNPGAVRPWQHVLELCEGYLELGARLMRGDKFAEDAWNFGPLPTDQTRVDGVVEKFLDTWGGPDHPVDVRPSPLHEARLLRLDISKAVSALDWQPRLSIDDTIGLTAEWYRAFYREPGSALAVTRDQLRRFRERAGLAT